MNNENNVGGAPRLPGLPSLPTPPKKNATPPLPNLPSLPTQPARSSLPTQPVQPSPQPVGLPSTQTVLPTLPTLPVQPVLTTPQPAPTPEPVVYVQPTVNPPQQPVAPVFQQVQQQPMEQQVVSAPQPSMQQPEPAKQERKTSKRFGGAKQKNTPKAVTKKDEGKVSSFSGKRKNVLIARVVVFGIVGALMLAGVTNFLPKSSGLAPGDGPLILSKVRENLNFTDFPKAQGEGIALGFTRTYLNYDGTLEGRNTRFNQLKTYTAENILNSIDIKSSTESNGTGTQTVTDGPYLIGSKMFKGGTAALFTTMTQINGSSWVYLEIPMYYDKKEQAISVSASPTFTSPTKVAKVPDTEHSNTWASDREIEEKMKDDIVSYLKAWTTSSGAEIERYLTKKEGKVTATPAAITGLGSTVNFIKVERFAVEAKQKPETGSSAEAVSDFRVRNAEVTVLMEQPGSGLVYSQTYRLIVKYVNDDWFIEDIQNVSVLIDRDAILSKKPSKDE